MKTAAELYDSFPDDLKKAIRAYEPLELKTPEQLRGMMVDIRYKLDLPPWHPFTAFVKITARAASHGKTPEPWVIRKTDPANYTSNTTARWVRISLVVKRAADPDHSSVMQFAISPKLNMVWAYSVEGPITATTLKVNGVTVTVTKAVIMRYAREAIKKQKANTKHDFIAVFHTVRPWKRLNTEPKESGITLQDIMTPDPEAPKAPPVAPKVEPVRVTTTISTLSPEDSEMLLTLFELGAIKLKEMGMYSTFNRWRAAVKRLTKKEPNETNETESTAHDRVPGPA